MQVLQHSPAKVGTVNNLLQNDKDDRRGSFMLYQICDLNLENLPFWLLVDIASMKQPDNLAIDFHTIHSKPIRSIGRDGFLIKICMST